MKFNYIFFDTVDVMIAEIETDIALPGIEAGNELILHTDDWGKLGGLLHIDHVRVSFSHLQGRFDRYDIHVICHFGDSKVGFA